MNNKNVKTNQPKKFKKRNRNSINPKNGKGESKFVDDYKGYSCDSETNDPVWYAQYPELMQDAASIPYSIPTGTKISWGVNVDSAHPLVTTGDYAAQHSVPGILTFGVIPTPGLALDATSPLNVASDMLYTKVRAENSGARNYDSPDLMLYCLAMDQVYSMLTWFNRIYGTLMLYSQVNRYLPKALLRAQHVDFDDMILHINDFKAFLDTATAQAAVFSVPNDMKLFNRHAFMYQNVYKDADTHKSQLYQFAPRAFYVYDELSGPGQLLPVDIIRTYPNGMKFLDFVNLFHTLMDPIISAEDFNIMSGDILKAFGEGNLIKLQLMPNGYTIYPIVDYEVLTQMKNATISNLMTPAVLTLVGDPTNWAIHQDPTADFLQWNPYLTKGASARHLFSTDRYLSTYKTNPTPADNMVATRLMFSVHEIEDTSVTPSSFDTYFDAVGSEFIYACVATFYGYDTSNVWTTISHNLAVHSENIMPSIIAALRAFLLAKHFDFCPAIYAFYQSTTDTYYYPVFDVDNWTIVHSYELEKMHRTALMSMLRVPMIGSALPSKA